MVNNMFWQEASLGIRAPGTPSMVIRRDRLPYIALLLVALCSDSLCPKCTILAQKVPQTRLAALITLAQARKKPIGFMVGGDGELCLPVHGTVEPGAFEEQLTAVLAGSNYVFSNVGEVTLVARRDPSADEQRLIAERFDQFTSRAASKKYLASLLNGYVAAKFAGAKGFIVEALGPPESEIVEVGRLVNVTPVEVANKIVTLGSKGAWITTHRVSARFGDYPIVFDIIDYNDLDLRSVSSACAVNN